MEEKDQLAPTEFVHDGKLTRRTFVKGAGWLTITSAVGATAVGCAPSAPAEKDELAETGPVADPEEGFTYKSACCSVNCTSRCHLRARVKEIGRASCRERVSFCVYLGGGGGGG